MPLAGAAGVFASNGGGSRAAAAAATIGVSPGEIYDEFGVATQIFAFLTHLDLLAMGLKFTFSVHDNPNSNHVSNTTQRDCGRAASGVATLAGKVFTPGAEEQHHTHGQTTCSNTTAGLQ